MENWSRLSTNQFVRVAMAFIYRDFLTPSRFEWNRASALYQKFNKVWPKITVGGIEVYSNRMNYWDKWNGLRTDVPFKRFLNALGVEYKTFKEAEYEGAKYVYFKLDPKKYDYLVSSDNEIVSSLNNVFDINDEFELYIHYTGESKRVVDSHWTLIAGMDPTKISSYTIDTVGIRNTLHSDPMKYFANAELSRAGTLLTKSNVSIIGINQTARNISPRSTPVTSVSYDTATGHLYSVLALLDNGSVFEQVGGIYDEIMDVTNTVGSDVYLTYSYKMKFKVVAAATTTSYIVTQINTLGTAMQTALAYTGSNIYGISNSADDTSLKQAVIAMNDVVDVVLTHDGKFRVDALASMKRKEFSKLLGKTLGSDYDEEDAKWYEVLFAIVIIVLSVVIGVLSAGGLAPVMTQLVAAATALAVTSAALTVGLLIYASAFPFAADMIRLIGRFAQIIGVLASITGVMAAIQNAWNKAAQAAVDKKIISDIQQYTVTQFVKDMVVNLYDKLKTSIVDKVTAILNPSQWSLPSLSEITLSDVSGWLSNIGDGFKMYMKFFGDSKQYSTVVEEDQATKEDGVEGIFLAQEMVYNNDALYRVDLLVKNNLGGQKTENFMAQIY